MTHQPVDATKPAPATVRSPPRWRRALVATLVIAGCILAPVSVVGVWLDGTLLNTDHYVSTVGPLARNSAIQDAIASRVTTEIVQHTALERRVKSALPSQAAFLDRAPAARPLADAADGAVVDVRHALGDVEPPGSCPGGRRAQRPDQGGQA